MTKLHINRAPPDRNNSYISLLLYLQLEAMQGMKPKLGWETDQTELLPLDQSLAQLETFYSFYTLQI